MPRRSSTGSSPVTSWPSMKIRPRLGSISRLTIFRVVDFPQPDGPTRHDHLAALHVEVQVLHRDRAVGVGLAHAFQPDHRIFGNVHAVTLLGSVAAVSAITGPAGAPSGSAAESKCYSAVVNEWVCKDYFVDRQDELVAATREHLVITVFAVLLGLVLAIPLALVARRSARGRERGARLLHRRLHDPVARAVPADRAVHRPRAGPR